MVIRGVCCINYPGPLRPRHTVKVCENVPVDICLEVYQRCVDWGEQITLCKMGMLFSLCWRPEHERLNWLSWLWTSRLEITPLFLYSAGSAIELSTPLKTPPAIHIVNYRFLYFSKPRILGRNPLQSLPTYLSICPQVCLLSTLLILFFINEASLAQGYLSPTSHDT